MGVHVTLTGLRGGVAPPLGVLVYMGLEASHAGAGEFALLLPFAMTLAGALGFNRMRRRADAHPAAPRVARAPESRAPESRAAE
jgi:hypothetical protein